MAAKTRNIDSKYCAMIASGRVEIVKRTNGNILPESEPLVLFRAQDILVVPMLETYRDLCEEADVDEAHLNSINDLILRFKLFAADNPHLIKTPDTKKEA